MTFIGSKPQADAFVPLRSLPIRELQVNTDNFFEWLRFLRDVNPLFNDITIDDSEGLRHALENLTAGLINRVVSIEN